MMPADQGLDAGHLGGTDVDLRLELERHLAVLDRAPQLSGQRELADAVGVGLGAVDDEAGLAALGRVHRDVGVLQELASGLAVVRVERDADADADLEDQAVDAERLGQRIDQALGHPARGREIGRARQQHRELVAAQPRHGVDPAQRPLQPRTDLGQQQVAEVMPESVVDVLEAVEVEQQHRHRHPGALGGVDRHVDPVVEQGAVGQGGERVVQREALELGLLRLAFGDVAQDRDAEPFLVDPDPAERGLDREVAPVWCAPRSSWLLLGLRQSLEREAVVVGQQGRDRAADDRARPARRRSARPHGCRTRPCRRRRR